MLAELTSHETGVGVENIIKDRKNSAMLKANLLSGGIKIQKETVKELRDNFKENNYGYNNPNWFINNEPFILPQEIVLPEEIIVSFRYRPNSPYEILVKEGEPFIFDKNRCVTKVKFSKRPAFYNKYTSDGALMKNIGSIYGLNALVFFTLNHCEFWDKGLQCKFCSIVPTREMFRKTEIQKDIDQVVEVALEATNEGNVDFINFIGGSFLDHNLEIQRHIRFIKAVKNALNVPEINGFLITIPPDNLKMIDKIYESGIKGVKFNLEIYTPHLFKQLCPGKALFGREKFIKALEYAVKVFGEGNVYSNLIVGLEDKESLLEGAKYLASMGVVPEGNTFHPDKGTSLAYRSTFSQYELITIYREIAKIIRENHLKPFLSQKSLRGSLSWEAYFGLI